MRLILDTNVVRMLGYGEISANVLSVAKREGLQLHLGHGSFLELFEQLGSRRFAWDPWVRARDVLGEVLDDENPVLLGWKEGLSSFGITYADKAADETEVNAERVRWREHWRIMRRATAPEELEDRQIVDVGEETEVINLDLQMVRAELARLKKEWVDDFQRIYNELSAALGTLLPPRGERALNVFVDGVAAIFDRTASSVPPPSVRFDGMVRVLALLALRRLRRKDPYNPAKKSNDALDSELLRYFGAPAAVCTADAGIRKKLQAARSWQAEYLVKPADLARPEVRSRLLAFAWPASP